jgi:hypothetical protein
LGQLFDDCGSGTKPTPTAKAEQSRAEQSRAEQTTENRLGESRLLREGEVCQAGERKPLQGQLSKAARQVFISLPMPGGALSCQRLQQEQKLELTFLQDQEGSGVASKSRGGELELELEQMQINCDPTRRLTRAGQNLIYWKEKKLLRCVLPLPTAGRQSAERESDHTRKLFHAKSPPKDSPTRRSHLARTHPPQS